LADHGIVTSLLEHLELAEKAFDDATRQPSAKPFFYVAHPKTEFIVSATTGRLEEQVLAPPI
jgi:hypothetical protein